jgi:hypothetical protein
MKITYAAGAQSRERRRRRPATAARCVYAADWRRGGLEVGEPGSDEEEPRSCDGEAQI